MKLPGIPFATPILCAGSLALCFAACGEDDNNNNPGDPDSGMGLDASPDPDGPTPDGPPPTGDGIVDARAAADGTVDIDIAGATVTYVKPAIGTDPAGFFLQKETTGPALFVAVAADTLDPPPIAGDTVSLTVTSMATSASARQADGISDYTRDSQGANLGALTQNVSGATDLVSALADYESELVSATITVSGDFAGAGTDHQAGTVETTGITENTDLRFRIPASLQARFGLVPTCTTEVSQTPLWRFNGVAQISAWDEADFSNTSCPAPTIVAAQPLSQVSVRLEMVRAIDGATVTNAATQFTVDNGLTVSGATIEGNIVTLDVSGMVEGTTYTIGVATSVRDILGEAFAEGSNTAQFTGVGLDESNCSDGIDDDLDTFVDCLDSACAANEACNFLPQPYLWEVDADQVSNDTSEFIEILNKGASVDLAAAGYYVLLLNGGAASDTVYAAFALTGSLAEGGIHVLGNAAVSPDQVFADETLQNGADGVLLVQCQTCSNVATDFPNNLNVGNQLTFQSAGNQTVTKLDGLAYDTNDSDDADLMTKLGVSTQFNESGNLNQNTESNNRSSLQGWSLRVANPGQSGQQPN